jgi:endogenous inhibitor of DNA gyrase (YacG/DUF329 family)
MKNIEAICPACRATVTLESSELLLALRRHPPATYTMACPNCGALTVKPAESAVVALLRRASVPAVSLEGHPESPPSGPPFSLDDLLELHELLATDDWLSQCDSTGQGR